MKGGKQPFGYTIVEVLVVLAVSGMLFVISSTFISGKQEKTSFEQGSNQFATQIRGIINEVNNGEYSDIAFDCNAGGSNLTFTPPSSSNGQGSNQECVFLGKVIQLRTHDGPTKYDVFSVAGARVDGSNIPVTALSKSKLSAIDQGTISLTKKLTVPQGIYVNYTTSGASFRVKSYPTNYNSYAFAILQGLGSSTQVGSSTYNSGSQSVGLYSVAFIGQNSSRGAAVARINQSIAGTDAANFKPVSQICIPITDGSRGAIILVGSSASQINVQLLQKGETDTPQCP